MTLAPITRAAAFRAALAAAALTATACSEFEFAEQDLSIRRVAKTDQVLLEVDTRGLFGTSLQWGEGAEFIVERAAGRVRRMAEGERYLHLLSFPLIVDLDAEAATEPTPEENPAENPWIAADDLARIRRLFLDSVHVDASSAYLDSEGEVAVAQTVRIENATACIAASNSLITCGVREALRESEGKTKDDALDIFESQRSRDNLVAFMDAGGEWLTLSEEHLDIRIPMTPADLAILVKSLASDEADGNARALSTALLGGLTEVSLGGGVALFRFPVEKDGALHWRYRGERRPEAKALAAHFGQGELKRR